MEDGQTVRMPVGKKEVFITFRVSIFINSSVSVLISQQTQARNNQARHEVHVHLSAAIMGLTCIMSACGLVRGIELSELFDSELTQVRRAVVCCYLIPCVID